LSSQARINWLALEGEHAEDAFMNATQGFQADKAFKPFDA
jgi:hypothetical protein